MIESLERHCRLQECNVYYGNRQLLSQVYRTVRKRLVAIVIPPS